jgi:peptidoglycan/LPS O-acetylase OafA/YrhL
MFRMVTSAVPQGVELNLAKHVPLAPAYRPDIDGLRAIAVVAVVFFHAGIPGFGGGYVGVDVFFVISGYLITAVLDGSAAKPLRPWLTEFYIRRGRRILPALLVTLLVAAVVAIAVLLPSDLVRFGEYLSATTVFLTNFTAWREGVDYFQIPAAHVAIRHLWSIAIEEQFYLVYPIALFVISRRLPRHRTAALGALAVVSLAVCVWGSYYWPIANFFLAPTRAWELLLGATLATTEAYRIRHRIANELLAAVALLALAFIIYRYGAGPTYPGLYTLAPCTAAAALIVTGRQRSAVISRLLSLRPLVFTGLISYSFYLWHLPILSLVSYYNIVNISAVGSGALIAATYLIAAVSWKLIETPIRTRGLLGSNRSFLVAALAVNIVVLGIGGMLYWTNGLPRRFPQEVQIWGHGWYVGRRDVIRCMNLQPEKVAAGGLCRFGPDDADAPRALVWGDSHALALLPAYEQLATSHHVRLYFGIQYACRPLLGLANRTQTNSEQSACLQFNAAMVQAVRRLEPRLVILNAHWVDADADLISRSNLPAVPGESNFGRGLRETLRQIGSAGRSVCAVLDVPSFSYSVPYALGVARKRGISEDFLKVSRAAALAQYGPSEREFRLLERRGALKSVDPKDLLCRADSCAFEAEGRLLYGDNDHLSLSGAQFVSSAIDGCFQDAAPLISR